MEAQTIEHFRKMAEADPGNELGHFSLGRACLEAGLHAEAAAALQRALDLNPNISKAYELLAASLLAQGKRAEAIDRLTQGVTIAASRGDMMPRDAMARTLASLGAPVPEIAAKAAPAAVGEGQVQCSRCGQVAGRMAHPPFSNAQGRMIQDRVCPACWREWVAMGTKVINELRLPLADPSAQRIYDQHMLEFLNLRG